MNKEMKYNKCVCSICGKVFNSERQLNGHIKVHKPEYEEQKRRQAENNKRRGELLRKQNEEEYNKNPKLCVVCGKPLSYKQAVSYKSKTCSLSCSVTCGNLRRGGHSEETKKSIKEGMLKYTHSEEGKINLDKKKKYSVCVVCGKTFHNPAAITCSIECANQIISKKRIENIIKNGTSNHSCKWELTYDNKVYMCDSKLEIASVIYMIEHLGAKNVERSCEVLYFTDKHNKIHRYNPDFICDINGKTTIIEIKQDINKVTKRESFTNYRMFINDKKEALKKFAKEKDYDWMWITPNSSFDLRKLYRSILSGKHNYTFVQPKPSESR